MRDKVLIIDDNPIVCRLLEGVARSHDMEPTIACCSKEAYTLLDTHRYDIILIDIMLGDMEGFDMIKSLRDQGNSTPMMTVSDSDNDLDAIYGLTLGADNYITHPIQPMLVGAQMRAMVRRSRYMRGMQRDRLTVGAFSYEATSMQFYKGDEELRLSARESALMLHFMRHPRQTVTKDVIYEQIWGSTAPVDNNAIMVYMNRLRGKIETDRQNPRHIVTVRGQGYRFEP